MPYKFHVKSKSKMNRSGSGGQAPAPGQSWYDDLVTRLTTAGVAADVPQAQLDGMLTFYNTMVTNNLLPATPSGGTGKWLQFTPLFGMANIATAVVAAIGVDATNEGLTDAMRLSGSGALDSDGSGAFDSNVSSPAAGFSVIWHEPLSRKFVTTGTTENSNNSVSGSRVNTNNEIRILSLPNSSQGRFLFRVRRSTDNSIADLTIGWETLNNTNPSGEFNCLSINATTGVLRYWTGETSTPFASFDAGDSLAIATTISLGYFARNQNNVNFSERSAGRYNCIGLLASNITNAEYAIVQQAVDQLMSDFGRTKSEWFNKIANDIVDVGAVADVTQAQYDGIETWINANVAGGYLAATPADYITNYANEFYASVVPYFGIGVVESMGIPAVHQNGKDNPLFKTVLDSDRDALGRLVGETALSIESRFSPNELESGGFGIIVDIHDTNNPGSNTRIFEATGTGVNRLLQFFSVGIRLISFLRNGSNETVLNSFSSNLIGNILESDASQHSIYVGVTDTPSGSYVAAIPQTPTTSGIEIYGVNSRSAMITNGYYILRKGVTGAEYQAIAQLWRNLMIAFGRST